MRPRICKVNSVIHYRHFNIFKVLRDFLKVQDGFCHSNYKVDYNLLDLPFSMFEGNWNIPHSLHISSTRWKIIMPGKKYHVIGISGTTNSGKTTVTKQICEILPCSEWICQDSYFWPPDDPHVEKDENGFEDWDRLSALNMDQMLKDVKQWIARQEGSSETSFLIIEGFIIFNHSELCKLFDQKYFIKIDKQICEQRRLTRCYNPPDVPGYFEHVVWPSYIRHLEALKDQNDIVYIDGMVDLETLGQTVFKKIQCALGKQ